MGVRKYRGQIVCDKRWPDGMRLTRVCANKTQARQLLERINVQLRMEPGESLRKNSGYQFEDSLL